MLCPQVCYYHKADLHNRCDKKGDGELSLHFGKTKVGEVKAAGFEGLMRTRTKRAMHPHSALRRQSTKEAILGLPLTGVMEIRVRECVMIMV